MLIIIYLSLIVRICIVHLCGMIVPDLRNLKIAYNNSLRRLLGCSASEMFVNLNIPLLGELLRKFIFSFKSSLPTIW